VPVPVPVPVHLRALMLEMQLLRHHPPRSRFLRSERERCRL
jgi:hypothetical protein